MATSQLTKQNQQQVTDIQSLNMMRNTIRTAVSSVAYLRNLFDEEAFEDKNVSGLQLKVLRPFNKESKLILNWLEDGVFDALEKGYLKLLVFGIHGECDELIESYHFHFNYCDTGTNINLERRSKDQEKAKLQKISNNSTYCTKEYARQQTVQLLRALILLTQSLSPLPEARYLSMKLWYYEDRVPKEYEPNHFRPARSSDILSFNEIPIDTTVGNVDTKYHSLTVKVKSAVDNYEENKIDNIEYKIQEKNAINNHKFERKSMDTIKKSSKKRKQYIDEEITTGSSNESNEIRITSISPSLNMSIRDDRTVKTTNTVDLLEKATETVGLLKYVNKGNLSMALDIEKEKASNLIEMLLECGIISNRMVRGKGYPVINKENNSCKRLRLKPEEKRNNNKN
ncbi:hypothetical protein FG386_000871 [Cryptosporidium ryanae]|uniref:uncharacterized protein n=1 Tax=Cryptosporidium ryanae TaxID=515981 RepID=UPI00351A61BF|nr:hypothetical protein FG386_000871 [Cryptosporidium ryanae]